MSTLILDKKLDIDLQSLKTFTNIISQNLNSFIINNHYWFNISSQKIVSPLLERIEISEQFIMKKKIPFSMLIDCLYLFREVYNTHRTEALVFICWNKLLEKYELIVPEQKVSPSLSTFDISESFYSVYDIVLNIHSHHTMKITFSGIDNNNDTGQFYISCVFRDILENPTCDCRIFNLFEFKNLNISDIFEIPTINVPFNDLVNFDNIYDFYMKNVQKTTKYINIKTVMYNIKPFNNNKTYPKNPMNVYDEDESIEQFIEKIEKNERGYDYDGSN